MANPFVHVELNTTDLGKAKTFYKALFDWKLQDMPMPQGTYTLIEVGEGTGGGMMKQLMPARPFEASVRTNTTPHSASCACEMNVLVPLRTQWLPCFTPRLLMALAGSEPPLGSVMAKNVRKPSRSAGTAYFSICSRSALSSAGSAYPGNVVTGPP